MRRSVSASPSRVEGYSRPSRSNASGRKRSSGLRAAAIAFRPLGSGARNAAQAAVASASASGPSSTAAAESRTAASCSGVSSASPPKCATPGCSPMQISVMRSGATLQRGEPGEDLRELQLVVEVGLEPEHVAAVAVGGERRVAGLELRQRPLDAEEPGPHAAQLRVAGRGHRALVQHVAPREAVADERPQPRRRRVAVGDVERTVVGRARPRARSASSWARAAA